MIQHHLRHHIILQVWLWYTLSMQGQDSILSYHMRTELSDWPPSENVERSTKENLPFAPSRASPPPPPLLLSLSLSLHLIFIMRVNHLPWDKLFLFPFLLASNVLHLAIR